MIATISTDPGTRTIIFLQNSTHSKQQSPTLKKQCNSAIKNKHVPIQDFCRHQASQSEIPFQVFFSEFRSLSVKFQVILTPKMYCAGEFIKMMYTYLFQEHWPFAYYTLVVHLKRNRLRDVIKRFGKICYLQFTKDSFTASPSLSIFILVLMSYSGGQDMSIF